MNTIKVIGLPITTFDQCNPESEIVELFETTKPLSFHGYSIDTLYLMKTIPRLYEMRQSNDFFLCDGRGYYYFMKLLGVNGVRKLSLPALTMMLVSIAANHNKSIFLLGATVESNKKAIEVLTKGHSVKKVSGRNGYFKPEDEVEIVKEINKSSPDILFLGMSSPKKDEFVFRWKDKLNVKIILHCGGMIDIISGKTKMYPKWIKDFCLAAVYRFVQEPLRLRRDIINAARSFLLIIKILFIVKVLRRSYNFPGTLNSPDFD